MSNGWRPELAAAVVGVLCYVNTLPNDFCFDDDPIVRYNPVVNEPGCWIEAWTTDLWYSTRESTPHRDLLYRPVAVASYRLIRQLAGPSPLWQHMVNVLLHAAICALVARLCRVMGGTAGAALVAGLLFAVLPIHSEAVASIVGRADLLSTLGVLIVLSTHRRSPAALSPGARAMWRVLAATAAFVAIGSKESGAACLPLAVLFDAYFFSTGPSSSPGRSWWSLPTVARLSYLVIPAGLYVGLRYIALDGKLLAHAPLTKTVNVLHDAPDWQQALGVVQLWGMYWAKTIWPAVLSIKYSINSIRLATGMLDPHVILGVSVAGLLTGLSLVRWRRGDSSVAILTLALLVSYLPTANALVKMQVFFAERVWYLPSVWPAAMAGLVVAKWLRRPAYCALVSVVVVAMLGRCWMRNAEWRNNELLYAAAHRDQPDGVGAIHLYAQWLTSHEREKEAIPLLRRALEIDLGFTDAHRTLGDAYRRVGDLRAALRHLQIAEMQVPGFPPTRMALNEVVDELSRSDPELAGLRQAAAAGPEDERTELELLRKLQQLGLTAEALERLHGGEDRFAGSAEWQAEYAVTLVLLNDRDGAIERYRRSLELQPHHPQRAVELAMLYLERRRDGDVKSAWRWMESAYALSPDSPPVLACRAELLAVRGDLAEAIATYRRAIERLPSGNPLRPVYIERLKTLGGRP